MHLEVGLRQVVASSLLFSDSSSFWNNSTVLDSKMASLPPSICCTQGVLHEGEPQGEDVKIESSRSFVLPRMRQMLTSFVLTANCYISYPKDKNTHDAIFFYTDIIGHKLQNSRL